MPGSVINYRSIFLKDQMYVDLKPATDIKVQVLDLETLEALVKKHGEYNGASQSEESSVRA